MRKFIIEHKIEKCRDCPYIKFLCRSFSDIEQNGGTNFKCNNPDVAEIYLDKYLNIDELPDWCPLPTIEEDDNEKKT